MTTSTPERVFELLRTALDLPAEARSAFLSEECRGEPAVRAEVEALLVEDARAGDPDGDEPVGVGLDLVRHLGPSTCDLDEPIDAGRYRLMRVIGRGGMGVVYEAEQDQPKRTVAIKLISITAMGELAFIRFRREIELLGRLSHPCIAQIHDAGTLTIAGAEQPFYAMELIEGLSISDYAREHNLSVNDRLDLIARVGDAVQHAHHKGVIHRDIKPANVLVNTDGVPKVLDFGIARAMGTTAQHSLGATATGIALGTLGYMSPEQVAGQAGDVDLRTDIYALGALAYEVLTGRLPHDLADATLAGAFRAIADLPPARPSTIDASLRGDIETILLTALEKDPARRYQSAGEMASDIRRCIAGEPISAHPPSAMYRVRKFAKRNKALVTGVLLALATLAAGTVVSTTLAVYASSQRRQADIQREAADVRAYKNAIAAAAYAIELGDITAAQRHLESAPAKHRGWEWRHLNARATSTVATAPPGDTEQLARWLGVPPFEPPTRVRKSGVIEAPPEGLLARAMTPSGRTFIDLDDTGLIECDADTGQVVARVSLPPSNNRSALDPERRRIAVMSQGEGKTRTEALVYSFDGSLVLRDKGVRSLRSVALNADRLTVFRRNFGRSLVCELSVLDLHGGGVIAHTTFEGDEEWMASNGEVIALVGEGPAVTIRSADDLTLLRELGGHGRGPIEEVSFSNDGRLLATRTSRQVIVWDTQTWAALIAAPVLRGSKGVVGRMVFTPDDTHLVVVDHSDAAHLLACAPSGFTRLTGHETYVYHVCFSPAGDTLATIDYAGGVHLWDGHTFEPKGEARVGQRPLAAGFDEDGALVTMPPAQRVDMTTLRTSPVPDAGRFRGGAGMRLREAADVLPRVLRGGASFLLEERFVATSHSKQFIVTRVGGDERSGVSIRSMGEELGQVELPARPSTVCFAPDDSALVIADSRGALTLVEPQTSRIIASSDQTGPVIHAVAMCPDGSRIATGSQDGVLRLWTIEPLEVVAELRAHTAYIFDVAFSPDGAQIATASGDHTVCIWDTRTAADRARPALASPPAR